MICKNENCNYKSTNIADFHTDHIHHFYKIRDEFLNIKNNIYPTCFKDNTIAPFKTFKEEDKEFEEEWINYHNSYVDNLRILCKSCNMSRNRFDNIPNVINIKECL